MFNPPGLQFYPAQAMPEQNKQSSQIRSNVALLQHAPVTNYAEDFQTRLEVVSKLCVPHNEVQRAYGEFVKKLNDMCYETIAEQLVRSRPVSVAGSVHSEHSQNTHLASRRTLKKSDNGSNSTIHRLFKAAEGVQKHLSTISESSHGDGLRANGPNKSKIVVDREKFLQNMDNKIDHFRLNDMMKCKPSRRIVSTKTLKKTVEQSSAEMNETEFNITKDSLRNSNMVFREQKKKTAIRANGYKRPPDEVDFGSVVLKTKKSRNEIAQESHREIRSNHKKTALSPFYQRQNKQHRSSSKTTPLFKY